MLERKPLRKCIGCGKSLEKSGLIRVVKTESGFSIDRAGRMNGRAAYICNNADCFAKARKCKGLEKSFRMSVPAEIYEILEKEFVFGSK